MKRKTNIKQGWKICMNKPLKFEKKKNFIICIDSDGCAMDTMNIKHEKYFGPLVFSEWDVRDKERFLKEWNKINLFSKTRGINRFKAFVLTFKKMEESGKKIDDTDQIEKWINTTNELSNKSLMKEIEEQKKNKITSEKLEQLEKLLKWSEAVNNGIKELEGVDKPFEGVREALAKLHKIADIAVVSSANKEAILSEWTRHGLIEFTDVIFSQEEGTKSDSLRQIKNCGYENNKILMVGDSPGDLTAASENDVLFYPILFGKEKEMWEEIVNVAEEKFINGNYNGEYENKLIDRFNKNLSE